jgi:hypothetical protein
MNHFYEGAAPPLYGPASFVLHSHMNPSKTFSEPVFDPAVHLNLIAPKSLKPLIQSPVIPGDPSLTFPLEVNERPSRVAECVGEDGKKIPFTGLAYTEPMRILSDEGVRLVKAIVKENEEYAKSNERR